MLISKNDILKPTCEHRFAIRAFNVADSRCIRAVMGEAEATRTSAIISIHPSEHDFVTRTGVDTLATAIGTAHGIYLTRWYCTLGLPIQTPKQRKL